MSNVQDEIETMQPPALELLERQLIAALYAIWRAQGKSKRVVDGPKKEGMNEQRSNCNSTAAP